MKLALGRRSSIGAHAFYVPFRDYDVQFRVRILLFKPKMPAQRYAQYLRSWSKIKAVVANDARSAELGRFRLAQV